MKIFTIQVIILAMISLSLPACETQEVKAEPEEGHKVVVTSPLAKDVVITQQFVCQIHSRKHIDVCALETGYLEEIGVKEGQRVKKGDLLFKIVPVLYKGKLDAEVAEELLERETIDGADVARIVHSTLSGSEAPSATVDVD